jgi:hypothetical protein
MMNTSMMMNHGIRPYQGVTGNIATYVLRVGPGYLKEIK